MPVASLSDFGGIPTRYPTGMHSRSLCIMRRRRGTILYFGGLNKEEFVRSGYEYDSDVGSTRGQLVTNLPLNCPFYHLSKCGRQVELQPCLRRSGEVRCELANIRQKVCREVVKKPKKAGFLVVFLPAGTLYCMGGNVEGVPAKTIRGG